MQAWVGATDLEAFEEAIGGLVFFMFNEVGCLIIPCIHYSYPGNISDE